MFQAENPSAAGDWGGPVSDILSELRERLLAVAEGEVATYIPELGTADPAMFSLAICTVDGQVYSAGPATHEFTIQSVSKPFMYGYALREFDLASVLEHVGVEPTGEAFNSIILDDTNNRPFNPMVNAGAIAVAELMKGETRFEREQNMLKLFGQFAGRRVEIDEAVFRSEKATGHRNRAIAYMMLNSGMIRRDPEDVLDLYFKQCSISVTTTDLAVMAATLANDGVNPRSGEAVLRRDNVRDVLTVMNSCGMYNYAGQWAFEVGIPAKSGVSGGIIAVIPGQLGIGLYSPPLDQHGNSVRGVKACQALSSQFGLHAFNSRTNVHSVIRREYRADSIRSKRLRRPSELRLLNRHGSRIAAIEAQGPLFFGSVERLTRRLAQLHPGASHVIVDFRRAHVTDGSALLLIRKSFAQLAAQGVEIGVVPPPPEAGLDRNALLGAPETGATETGARQPGATLFEDADDALETFEDAVLRAQSEEVDDTKFAFSQIDLFAGLSRPQQQLLHREAQAFAFEPGEVILREGDPANLFFVIARGSVSVTITLAGGRRKRVACIGPGLSFGEMALLDGGPRSADVVADEYVVCYGFSVQRLRELSGENPEVLITIMANLAKEFSARLRRANDEIRGLH